MTKDVLKAFLVFYIFSCCKNARYSQTINVNTIYKLKIDFEVKTIISCSDLDLKALSFARTSSWRPSGTTSACTSTTAGHIRSTRLPVTGSWRFPAEDRRRTRFFPEETFTESLRRLLLIWSLFYSTILFRISSMSRFKIFFLFSLPINDFF